MKIICIVILLFVLLPLQVHSQFLSGKTVTVSEKTSHDVYLGDGTVLIQAPVIGDLHE